MVAGLPAVFTVIESYGPDGEPLNATSRLATISFDHARDLVEDLQNLLLTHDTPRVGKCGITK